MPRAWRGPVFAGALILIALAIGMTIDLITQRSYSVRVRNGDVSVELTAPTSH